MTNTRLDLSGSWQLREDRPGSQPIPAEVPGDTHSALLAACLISDPNWGRNELDLQHLNRQDWVFSRAFAVDEALLKAKYVYLHCDSLDTIAEVYLNGLLAGQSTTCSRAAASRCAPSCTPATTKSRSACAPP